MNSSRSSLAQAILERNVERIAGSRLLERMQKTRAEKRSIRMRIERAFEVCRLVPLVAMLQVASDLKKAFLGARLHLQSRRVSRTSRSAT